MKQLIIILFIALGALTVKAQAQQQSKPITIRMDTTQLLQLQNVLGFSYQYLLKSDAPARDVEQVRTVIQQLFPILVPMKKDTVAKTPVKATPKK